MKKASRLRVQGLSKKSMVLWAFVPAVAAYVLGAVFGLGVELSLAIAGTTLGIATFVLSLFQREGPRNRRIAFVPMANNSFSHAIYSGLVSLLNNQESLKVEVQWPPGQGNQPGEWQLETLRSGFAATADAVVIVPSLETDVMWSELTRLVGQGVFVVVLDTKPPNAVFVDAEVEAPSFVGSDFSKGGSFVGKHIASYLQESTDRKALVSLGPLNTWPATERSRSLTIELCRAGVAGQISFIDFDKWDEARMTKEIVNAIVSMGDGDTVGDLMVYCPNDRVAEQVNHDLPVEYHGVTLAGYDGAVIDTGELILYRCQKMTATIDTKPREQGATAARLLIQEHVGTLRGRTTVYVEPELISKV